MTAKEQYQRACHLQRLIGFLIGKEDSAPEPIIKWAIRHQRHLANLELGDFPPNMRHDALKSCPVWHHSPLKNSIGTLQVHSANPVEDNEFMWSRVVYLSGDHLINPVFLHGVSS